MSSISPRLAKSVYMLDDSPRDYAALSEILSPHGIQPVYFGTPAEALPAAAEPGVWIVDVFLEGGGGYELSNEFIRTALLPRGLPYCRYTGGAPDRCLEGLTGFGVFSKSAMRAKSIHHDYVKLFVDSLNNALQMLPPPTA